jgi:KipI family sensor histidine kinase inhibitor
MNPHAPRIRDAGDSALLIEWDEAIDPEINARAIAMAAAIREAAVSGVRDVVSTYRSVAVFFNPLMVEPDRLRSVLAGLRAEPEQIAHGKRIEIPVAYGGEAGPDLATVAEWAKLSAEAVIERHAHADYRVFMLGFLPGFAYLGSVDTAIAAPRRRTPRVRVPAGSVGIAGRNTGIYPRESPGGWQLIGRSAVKVFDVTRAHPSLFAPGDVVRFRPVASQDLPDNSVPRPSEARIESTRAVTVVRAGLFTTIQDRGRWGQQASGVPVSGAMDVVSHRVANLLVGNRGDAATLEVTLVGPELRVEQETLVAIAGADLQPSIDGSAVPLGVAATCRAGSVLRFGERRSGARAYVAFDGGVDVPMTLGSRSTHVGAALGGVDGRALAAGDRLPLGRTDDEDDPSRSLPPREGPVGGARLRILPGPQDGFFSELDFTSLERTRFVVTPQSNRMGYRLSGTIVRRATDREMISDAAFVGAIQVPPSGEPILLMSDRQTTGGYPQMATVITADLPLAGQLAPGDWVEFVRCTRAEAIAALRDQEAMLGGLT